MPKTLVKITQKDDDLSYKIKGSSVEVICALGEVTESIFRTFIFREELELSDEKKFKVVDIYLNKLRQQLEQVVVYSKGEW